MSVEIDDEILKRLAERARANGFESTEAYTNTLLQTVLDELNQTEEDEQIEERLEDLGYL